MNQELDIVALAKSGLPPKEIRLRLNGVTSHMVSAAKRKHGLAMDPRGSNKKPSMRTTKMMRKARAMKSNGYSYRQIGDKLGFSRQRAQQLILNYKTSSLMGKKCDFCGRSGLRLNRHHESYNSSKLKILCVACHSREHAKQNGGFWKAGKIFQSSVTLNYKKIHLGNFKTKEEARAAYLKAVAKIETRLTP